MDVWSLRALAGAAAILVFAFLLYLASLAGVVALDTREPVVCHSTDEDSTTCDCTYDGEPSGRALSGRSSGHSTDMEERRCPK